MTRSSLALLLCLAAAPLSAVPRPAGPKPLQLRAALEAGGKPWGFALDGETLAVTPPGAAAPSQVLAVHPSDTPPDHPVLELVDLNFDGVKDLRLLSAKHGQGQTIWQYWLFDPKTRRFVPNPQLDAALNPRPDTEGRAKTLSAYWNGGAAGRVYWRRAYRWDEGRLVLIEETEQTALPGRPDDFQKTVRRRHGTGLAVVEQSTVHDPH